jgi:IS30 family transposase
METEIKALVYNLMCDMKKQEIDPIGRAKLIQSYMDDTKISGRELSTQIGIAHSTLQDWLMWNKIDQKQYNNYVQEGHSDTDIYRSLRGGTLSGKHKAIDSALINCIRKLEIFKLRPPYSKDTKQYIAQLRKVLDVLESQVR